MWLIIHAEIKVNHVRERNPLDKGGICQTLELYEKVGSKLNTKMPKCKYIGLWPFIKIVKMLLKFQSSVEMPMSSLGDEFL